jgi:hypothetical protein
MANAIDRRIQIAAWQHLPVKAAAFDCILDFNRIRPRTLREIARQM